MSKLNVKKGDIVIVLSGKEKGKKGKILTAFPGDEKVIVEGVNFATKHQKPRRQGDVGGIIKQESALRVSKVMHICPRCEKPTRPKYEILDSGEKIRVCKHCGETI